jgi:hypothetical protein
MIMTRLSLCIASFSLLLTAASPLCRAGDFTLADAKDNSGALDDGRFDRQRLFFTSDVRVGYDDNPVDTPDQVTVTVADPATGKLKQEVISQDVQDSAFINFDLGVAYRAASPRATFTLNADFGLNYYFDRPGRSYDLNGGISASLSYKLSPRALLEVSSYDIYESAANYGSTNLTGFTGNGLAANAAGVSGQNDGDYFYTTDHVALTYQWAPRVSTVSGVDLVAFAYASEPYSTINDRVELYSDEQFRYLMQPSLTAVAEYRFGYIDYFGVSSDSITNFLLAGADYTFNPRLHGDFRAGVEFRNYVQGSEDDTSPYFEGTLSYDITRAAHLSATSRYSIEEGDLSADISNARVFRLGLSYDQALASRLRAYVSFYYTNADYNSAAPLALIGSSTTTSFTDNTFDVATGLSYSFNRRVSAEVGYTHTDVLSGDANREYNRNRYFSGVHLSF